MIITVLIIIVVKDLRESAIKNLQFLCNKLIKSLLYVTLFLQVTNYSSTLVSNNEHI